MEGDFCLPFFMLVNLKNKLIKFESPIIMGILNLTPDSFYKGSRIENKYLTKRVGEMLNEGATIIDMGGHSTRPGASYVSEDEELERLIPAIQEVVTQYPDAIISADTFRPSVAVEAVNAGAAIINDVFGGRADAGNMFETVAKLKVPYILMHSRGDFTNMNSLANYKNLLAEVVQELQADLVRLRALGVADIWIDPGFGFAKTVKQNFELLSKMEFLKVLDAPILAGLSRKSMIWRTLNTTPENALNGTTALNMVALQKGASILRVHDVKEAKECISLFEQIKFGEIV